MEESQEMLSALPPIPNISRNSFSDTHLYFANIICPSYHTNILRESENE